MSAQKIIYTIGHSTRSENEFIGLLEDSEIKLLADVRQYPGSKKFPQFNKEALEKELAHHHINYHHFPGLGGRRPPKKNSHNTAWENKSFRGYADYMETEEFKIAIGELEKMASEKRTAYMCSEAVWWRCHRALISDYLKWKGWKVLHILGKNKIQEHPYSSPAKIVEGELSYAGDQLSIF